MKMQCIELGLGDPIDIPDGMYIYHSHAMDGKFMLLLCSDPEKAPVQQDAPAAAQTAE